MSSLPALTFRFHHLPISKSQTPNPPHSYFYTMVAPSLYYPHYLSHTLNTQKTFKSSLHLLQEIPQIHLTINLFPSHHQSVSFAQTINSIIILFLLLSLALRLLPFLNYFSTYLYLFISPNEQSFLNYFQLFFGKASNKD